CHSAGTCDPGTGICSNPPVADRSSRADNDVCDGNQVWQQGVCQPGTPLTCTSPNSCQTATCNAASGCVLSNVANGTSCTGAGVCGTGTCQNGTCTSAGGSCDDGNPCTADACGANGACTHTPVT